MLCHVLSIALLSLPAKNRLLSEANFAKAASGEGEAEMFRVSRSDLFYRNAARTTVRERLGMRCLLGEKLDPRDFLTEFRKLGDEVIHHFRKHVINSYDELGRQAMTLDAFAPDGLKSTESLAPR